MVSPPRLAVAHRREAGTSSEHQDMAYSIYWLISENKKKTYVGFTDDIKRRIEEHKNKKIKTTTNFDNFAVFIIEKVKAKNEALMRERYWKSCAGRKRLKAVFGKCLKASSSSG